MAGVGRSSIRWYGPQVQRAMRAELVKGLRLAVAFARAAIIGRISKSSRAGGGVRSPRKGAGAPMTFHHSRPGEPPRADTGKLRQSIFGSVDGMRLIGSVGTTLKYGAYLEKGVSGGRLILPRQKKVLVCGVGGKWRFSRGHHQGPIKKRPYIYSTVRRNRSKIMYLITRPAQARFGRGAVYR